MPRRKLPPSPRDWTPEEREEVIAVHRTFNETPFGRRALEILKRDLWDNMSAVDEHGVLCDQRTTDINEGRRHAFKRITAYLDAYDYMTSTE